MRYDPERHRRHSIRLKGYDYSQAGAYYVTIVTRDRANLFGEVVDGQMRLNELGHVVREEWLRSEHVRHEIRLDEFVVMPNHVHGIIWIAGESPSRQPPPDDPQPGGEPQSAPVGAHSRAPLPPSHPPQPAHGSQPPPQRARRSLGSFIAGFKSIATTRINQLHGAPGTPVWQRNYYEHVIRDERALNRIRQYIRDNPMRWDLDRENPLVTPAARE